MAASTLEAPAELALIAAVYMVIHLIHAENLKSDFDHDRQTFYMISGTTSQPATMFPLVWFED